MKPSTLAISTLLALAPLLATASATAQEPASEPTLGVAVDGKVEVGASAAADADAHADADAAAADYDDAASDDTAAAAGPPSKAAPRSRSGRSYGRVRGGAGFGVLGAFDDGGSGTLGVAEGRLGAQLNDYFGLYAQLGLAGGDMEQPGGAEGRAGFATFAIIAELHIVDELAIGLGPVAMGGARDVDQVGDRYADRDYFDRFDDDDHHGHRREEYVSRYGLMLRVSPAVVSRRPSGRIHAFRPSFEIAILGTPRDVIAPEQPVMVLAGVSLNWDTW